MKLDRLLGITMELLNKKRVTATELSTRFEVSIRTIYRDIELINQSGIPIVAFPGADGGFELMDGYFLTKQHFSLEDFSTIYNLLKSAESAVSGSKYTSLMNKLGGLQPALLTRKQQNKVIFDISASKDEKELVLPIMKAIDQSKRISITYTNASGKVTERKIEPLNLIWERGLWYLDGNCLLRRDKRYFRLSRISMLEVLDESFTQWNEYKRPVPKEGAFTVHLRFELSVKQRVIEQFPEKFKHHGNFIEVENIFYSKEYALSVIFSYGSSVKIIKPDELKEDLIRKAVEIQSLYSDMKGVD